MLQINQTENNNNSQYEREKENDFDKEHFFIMDGSLDYYCKSKSRKYRGYKYRTLPVRQAS